VGTGDITAKVVPGVVIQIHEKPNWVVKKDRQMPRMKGKGESGKKTEKRCKRFTCQGHHYNGKDGGDSMEDGSIKSKCHAGNKS